MPSRPPPSTSRPHGRIPHPCGPIAWCWCSADHRGGGARVPDGGRLRVESAGLPIAAPAIGGGECTVSEDGTAVAVREGDVRPNVVGAFTELPDVAGIGLALTADTRIQTSIGAVKAAIGVV